MSLSPIELTLSLLGAQNFIRDLSSAGDAVRNTGRDIDSAGRDAQSAGRAFDDVSREANRAGSELEGAGRALARAGDAAQDAGRDMHGATEEAGDLGSALAEVDSAGLDRAGQSARTLTQTLETARAAGMALSTIGAGGIALSNRLIQEAEDGDSMQARLQSILKSQGRLDDLNAQNEIIQRITVEGHFEGDDELANGAVLLNSFSVETQHLNEMLELSVLQARTMGQQIDGVAAGLGKAYSTGKIAPLQKSGVVISPDEMKRIEDAYKISQQLGQKAFVDVLGPAIRRNTVALADSLTASKAAANDAARSVGDFYANIGQGSMEAQSSINGVVASIFDLANASQETEKSAGHWLTYGSYAATAGGAVVTVGSQAAITAASLNSLGVTGTAALGAVRLAALGATGTVLGLAGAALLAVGAIALAAYSWEQNRDKILNPVDSFTDRRSFAEQRADETKKTKLITLDQDADKLAPRDRMVLKRRISQGYQDLGMIDEAQKAMADFAQLRTTFPKSFKTVTSDEGKNLAHQLAALNTGANTSKRLGERDKPKKSGAQQELDEIQAKAAKIKAEIAGGMTTPPVGVLPEVAAPPEAPETKRLRASHERDSHAPRITLAPRHSTPDSHAPSQTAALLAGALATQRAADMEKLAASPSTLPIFQHARAPMASGEPFSMPESVMGALAMSTQVDALRWLESGGSLYNLPSEGLGANVSTQVDGGASGRASSGERTGAMQLRETGRKSNADGTERVNVTGTLELSGGGGLEGLVVGFRV